MELYGLNGQLRCAKPSLVPSLRFVIVGSSSSAASARPPHSMIVRGYDHVPARSCITG